MQTIRRHRRIVSGFLGLALVSARPLHGQTSGGDVSPVESAVCYVKLLGDMLANPLTSGAKYVQCIERAAED